MKPVLLGRDAESPVEYIAQLMRVTQAASIGDGFERIRAVFQHYARCIHARAFDEFGWRNFGVARENT